MHSLLSIKSQFLNLMQWCGVTVRKKANLSQSLHISYTYTVVGLSTYSSTYFPPPYNYAKLNLKVENHLQLILFNNKFA